MRSRSNPTPEWLARVGEEGYRTDGQGVVHRQDSPLKKALARSVITHEQYSAGEQYCDYVHLAHVDGSIRSPNMEGVGSSDPARRSGQPDSPMAIKAIFELERIHGLLGRDNRRFAHLFLIEERGLEELGNLMGYRHRHTAIGNASGQLRAILSMMHSMWHTRY